MRFASDNAGPAHPAAIAALLRANEGHAPAYGADAATARVAALLRDLLEAPEAAVHLVATGTAANALALACLCPAWATVFCQDEAHVQTDECGAVGFYSGATLTPVAGAHGRMDPAALSAAIARAGESVHQVQRGAVTLTNATEAGTVYDPDMVARLGRIARANGLPLHMDGARFGNAVAALGCAPADLTWRAGVEALSFGGTKNGLLGVEAVVFFDPSRSWEFELRRKRAGHLVSKHRFLAAQMEAALTDGLWLETAGAANARAARLSAGLAAAGARLIHPTEANEVFVALCVGAHRRVRAAGAEYYLWEPGGEAALEGPEDRPVAARLVCDWSTTEAEVDRFLALVAGDAAPAAASGEA